MRIKNLYKEFTQLALSSLPGDRELKCKAFSPLFENLYESKVVYYEKFMCLAKIEIMSLTSWGFRARATPLMEIVRVDIPSVFILPDKPWVFGGSWEFAMLCSARLSSPYAGWSIWTDPQLVKLVEQLIMDKCHEEAIKETLREETFSW